MAKITEKNISTTRRALFFPLLQLLLVLLLLRDFLWQREWIISTNQGGDVFVQFYMWRQFAATHLLNGEFPFWNPHIFGGIPFFGGMQSALLYPLNALFLFLPTAVAINWSIALHLWLMGLFTTLWLRHGIRVSHLAAGMGGIMMMFSGPFFMHIHGGQLSNLSVMVWVPLLLLALDRWFAGGGTRWLAAGALAVTMQILAGHPQYLYYTGITALLYGAVHLLRHSVNRRRDAGGIIILYLTGALLGAVQLLPGAEAAASSVRGNGVSTDFAASVSLTLFNIVTLISPHMLDLATDKTWLWETVLYFGVIGLVFALMGTGERSTRPHTTSMLLLASVLFVLALGSNTPLFPLLLKYLPGFNLFRGTTKFAFFAVLFLVVVAAIGIDRLRNMSVVERQRFVPPLLISGISLAIALFALHFLLGNPDSSNTLFARKEAKFIVMGDLSVVVALLAICGLLLRYRGKFANRLLPLLLVMLTVELFLNSATHLPEFNEQEIQHHPIVEALRSHAGEERSLNLDYRNAAMVSGGYELWGNDPGIGKRWADFVAATQGVPFPEHQNIYFSRLTPPLAIARVQYRFTATPDGVSATLADNAPFPRARLFHFAEVVEEPQLLKRLTDPAFDFRHTLLVEEPLTSMPVATGSGSVTITASTINSLQLDAVTDTPAVLLITDAYDKGWRAWSIDDTARHDYPVIPADHAFIGIPLEAGEHHIRLEYRPRTLTAGMWLSALGFVLLLFLLFRRSPRPVKVATL